MKNSKSTATRPTFAARLSKSRGRMVGVTTVTNAGTNKFNGKIRSVGGTYVVMWDRNRRENVKFALSSVRSVTGV